MAEWSIAAVLKTVEGHTSGGSNPSLSAKYFIKRLSISNTQAFSFSPYLQKQTRFSQFLTLPCNYPATTMISSKIVAHAELIN